MELSINQIDFTRYNLSANPFPNVGIPDETAQVYTNRVEELRLIGDTIVGTLRGSSSHVVIVASYGNGKTATLHYVNNQVKDQIPRAISIHLSYPGESFHELYSNFMYELGLKKLEDLVWAYLEKANNEINLRDKVESGEKILPEIIEVGKSKLFIDLSYNDFALAFLHIILSETKYLAWKYLCGEPILHEQRRQLDTVSLIDTDEKALKAWMSMKSIFSILDSNLICLFLDEIESIETLHTFKKQKLLNSLRRLIDLNPTGLSLIMACTPEAWNSIISDYHAFSERIFRNVVLRPLDTKMIRQFVIDYMRVYRINGDSVSDIFPFTEDSLDNILIAAQGNLRRVLMLCNRTIEKGAEAGYNEITTSRLKMFFPELFLDT